MEIINDFIPEMTIEEFAEKHGLSMHVSERKVPVNAENRYYAIFLNSKVMDGGFLVGSYGDGPTPQSAIDDYAMRISLKRIAISAYTSNRKEYDVPRLKVKP